MPPVPPHGRPGGNPRATTRGALSCIHGESLRAYEQTFDDLAAAITCALDAQGLRYDWDGDTGNRIKVIDMDWRRPLPEGEKL